MKPQQPRDKQGRWTHTNHTPSTLTLPPDPNTPINWETDHTYIINTWLPNQATNINHHTTTLHPGDTIDDLRHQWQLAAHHTIKTRLENTTTPLTWKQLHNLAGLTGTPGKHNLATYLFDYTHTPNHFWNCTTLHQHAATYRKWNKFHQWVTQNHGPVDWYNTPLTTKLEWLNHYHHTHPTASDLATTIHTILTTTQKNTIPIDYTNNEGDTIPLTDITPISHIGTGYDRPAQKSSLQTTNTRQHLAHTFPNPTPPPNGHTPQSWARHVSREYKKIEPHLTRTPHDILASHTAGYPLTPHEQALTNLILSTTQGNPNNTLTWYKTLTQYKDTPTAKLLTNTILRANT